MFSWQGACRMSDGAPVSAHFSHRTSHPSPTRPGCSSVVRHAAANRSLPSCLSVILSNSAHGCPHALLMNNRNWDQSRIGGANKQWPNFPPLLTPPVNHRWLTVWRIRLDALSYSSQQVQRPPQNTHRRYLENLADTDCPLATLTFTTSVRLMRSIIRPARWPKLPQLLARITVSLSPS
ncbi:hypothetical protein CH063_05598 [Colletotrichum higginsianum]|uniref:Uncharacterized protein n=1 Tax=Colletotrichum higginsianum (strain IMI 349063) TaxID=759273 RepID=H1UZJ4_COLHI|nr:hypothetical protein CH063_05598 [Colletotrichum higginsianum]